MQAVRSETWNAEPPLFERLLGREAFAALPAAVRALHSGHQTRFVGHASARPPRTWPARAAAALLGFPRRAQAAPLTVTIEAVGAGERWTRHWQRPMASMLWAQAGTLRERFGPLRLTFRLEHVAGVLHWRPLALSVFGLTLPRGLLRAIEASEWVEAGRYRFRARGAVPWLGTLLDYDGWLDVD